ncbi:MAG TPA: response regulator transcription factor [Hyphomicrobiaceae bacterium]|nr:response regulator transcription factor [Hyphomicrobiaceae bacterium]
MQVSDQLYSVAWEANAVPASFLVVDDHPLFLEALRLSLGSAYPNATIIEASSIAEARKVIAERGSFDLVLLDLSMPDTVGFEGLLELRTVYPKLPVVICSALEDPRIIHEAISYGASGFISKSVRRAELAAAIEEVMSGNVYLPANYQSPQPTVIKSDLAQRLASLTPQQLRVLKMLRQGMLNKQIAYELNVGETTVKAHVSEILRKLNVASRTQAVIEVSKIDFESILSAAGDPD